MFSGIFSQAFIYLLAAVLGVVLLVWHRRRFLAEPGEPHR